MTAESVLTQAQNLTVAGLFKAADQYEAARRANYDAVSHGYETAMALANAVGAREDIWRYIFEVVNAVYRTAQDFDENAPYSLDRAYGALSLAMAAAENAAVAEKTREFIPGHLYETLSAPWRRATDTA